MQKIDTELILAFIEGRLDKDTENQVRKMIDSSESWFVEYMELKQAIDSSGDFVSQEESEPVSINEASKEQRFSFPFIPSLGQSGSISFSNNFAFAITSLMVFCFILLSMFNQSVNFASTRYVDDFTEIDINEYEITVKSISLEDLKIYIVLDDLNDDPDYAYLVTTAYEQIIKSQTVKNIFFEDVLNFYDYINSTDLVNSTIFVFNKNNKISEVKHTF